MNPIVQQRVLAADLKRRTEDAEAKARAEYGNLLLAVKWSPIMGFVPHLTTLPDGMVWERAAKFWTRQNLSLGEVGNLVDSGEIEYVRFNGEDYIRFKERGE